MWLNFLRLPEHFSSLLRGQSQNIGSARLLIWRFSENNDDGGDKNNNDNEDVDVVLSCHALKMERVSSFESLFSNYGSTWRTKEQHRQQKYKIMWYEDFQTILLAFVTC